VPPTLTPATKIPEKGVASLFAACELRRDDEDRGLVHAATMAWLRGGLGSWEIAAQAEGFGVLAEGLDAEGDVVFEGNA
jgi:hypothetical protein